VIPKQNAVATRLGLTTRQVRRLVRQYEQQGPVGLISKLRNRSSNRRLKSDVAEHVFGILRSTYADFGPTLAAEKLRERHGVDLAIETVRSLMVAGGLWPPRRLRAPKIQQPRSHRAFMPTFIEGYNRRFGRLPRDRHDAHRAAVQRNPLIVSRTHDSAAKERWDSDFSILSARSSVVTRSPRFIRGQIPIPPQSTLTPPVRGLDPSLQPLWLRADELLSTAHPARRGATRASRARVAAHASPSFVHSRAASA
jgi:hypothetical protein